MALSKFLDPKNDTAFKRIFGTERNKDILIHFLNDIFERALDPIQHVSFIKTQLEPEIAAQRTSAVDIMCKARSGEYFIVEMQVARETGFEKRAQYYAAKAYIEQRKKDLNYKDLKEVTFLAVANFVMYPDKKAYLSHHHVLDIHTGDRNLKDFSFSFIELPKFKKNVASLKTITDKWIYFFAHAEDTHPEDLEKIIGSDKVILRAYEELDRYGWTEDELRAYDHAEMQAIIAVNQMDAARIEGEAIGLEKGKAKVIKNMNQQGLGAKEISGFTGIPLVEVQKILNC